MSTERVVTAVLTGGISEVARAAGMTKHGMRPNVPGVPAQTDAEKAATTVDDSAEANANRGRAALIATSPSGVLGTDPTGRRKLLGN